MKNAERQRNRASDSLLFREPASLRAKEAAAFFAGKRVLVTGGGGSIGSELCRTIAEMKPARLTILDVYENGAYELLQELRQARGEDFPAGIEICSVRDLPRLEELFEALRPEVVLHAAAHKHVPLMEDDPGEAVKNNVFGTKNAMDAAERFGAEKFVLISTDKAVRPSSVMGATKRLCEMLIGSRKGSRTVFAAVRFGNVLGSNGSVIPLFRRQIAARGPVTLTDRRATRYFMSIPEAAWLVIDACAMAKNGEIFALDMGEPVRILELAERMIREAGLEPYRDIEIREVGLRPGEKLYEERVDAGEGFSETANPMIRVGRAEELSAEEEKRVLSMLREAAVAGRMSVDDRKRAVLEALRAAVPEYQGK